MDWLLSILTITSNVLIGKKKYYGQLLLFFVNFLWIYYAISMKQLGLIPAALANIGITIYYAYKWFKEGKNEVCNVN